MILLDEKFLSNAKKIASKGVLSAQFTFSGIAEFVNQPLTMALTSQIASGIVTNAIPIKSM